MIPGSPALSVVRNSTCMAFIPSFTAWVFA